MSVAFRGGRTCCGSRCVHSCVSRERVYFKTEIQYQKVVRQTDRHTNNDGHIQGYLLLVLLIKKKSVLIVFEALQGDWKVHLKSISSVNLCTFSSVNFYIVICRCWVVCKDLCCTGSPCSEGRKSLGSCWERNMSPRVDAVGILASVRMSCMET